MLCQRTQIRGLKGIGFLYIRKGLKLRSFIHGGAERKRRAGTENITGIGEIAKQLRSHLQQWMKESSMRQKS